MLLGNKVEKRRLHIRARMSADGNRLRMKLSFDKPQS